MKIYLAARYSRREELYRYADHLRSLGHSITSVWLNGSHESEQFKQTGEFSAEDAAQWAMCDWNDVFNADCVISFTEEPRSGGNRGGRHVEFGIGLALWKRLIVVGPREHVFHYLPQVQQFDTFLACFEELEKEAYHVEAQ